MRRHLDRIPKTLLIGEDSFAYTPRGRPRDAGLSERIHTMERGTPLENHAEFIRLVENLGIRPLLLAVDDDGQRVWGVEVRTREEGGSRYAYLINLLREPIRVHLKWEQPNLTLVDLLDESQEVPHVLTLEPVRLMVGRVKDGT